MTNWIFWHKHTKTATELCKQETILLSNEEWLHSVHLFCLLASHLHPKNTTTKAVLETCLSNTVVLDRQHCARNLTLMKQKESVIWKKLSSLTDAKWSSHKSVTWKHSTNLSLGKHSSLTQFQTEVHTKKKKHLKILFISTFQNEVNKFFVNKHSWDYKFPIIYCADFQQII
jgi:hypothetical protein